jgi:splicing factor 3A subunit 2
VGAGQIEEGLQPRHRFMSAYEQRVEPADRNYQYIIVAAEPYENIAFKVPNREIDTAAAKFFTNWDREHLTFTLQARPPQPPPPRLP